MLAILLGSSRLRKLVAKREKLNLEIERVSELIIANANFLPDEEKADQLLQLEQLVADPSWLYRFGAQGSAGKSAYKPLLRSPSGRCWQRLDSI